MISIWKTAPVVAAVRCFAHAGDLGIKARSKSKVSESPRSNYAVAGFLFLPEKGKKWLKLFKEKRRAPSARSA